MSVVGAEPGASVLDHAVIVARALHRLVADDAHQRVLRLVDAAILRVRAGGEEDEAAERKKVERWGKTHDAAGRGALQTDDENRGDFGESGESLCGAVNTTAEGEEEGKEERRAEEGRVGESRFGEEQLEGFFETRVAGDRTVEEEETIRTIENTMAIQATLRLPSKSAEEGIEKSLL